MAKRIVFFNNKGGVGKTTMVYHTAYMMNELGYKVLVVDLDPQTNLTAMFLPQERLEYIFLRDNKLTITDAMQPVIEGEGYQGIYTEKINNNLFDSSLDLIIGNLALSAYEDKLSSTWTHCLDGDTYSFKVTSLFDKIIDDASQKVSADFVLIDIGPNLGAINRAVVIASDYIILPVGSDLFSLQGIKNLGETLQVWKKEWAKRIEEKPKNKNITLPNRKMYPIGYVAMQHTAKESKPVKAYLHWADKIPLTYQKYVLQNENLKNIPKTIESDPNCLGMLRHYRSLMPLAMEAHKPIFLLKPADGAIGAHFQSVQQVYRDFEDVTRRIIEVVLQKNI